MSIQSILSSSLLKPNCTICVSNKLPKWSSNGWTGQTHSYDPVYRYIRIIYLQACYLFPYFSDPYFFFKLIILYASCLGTFIGLNLSKPYTSESVVQMSKIYVKGKSMICMLHVHRSVL